MRLSPAQHTAHLADLSVDLCTFVVFKLLRFTSQGEDKLEALLTRL